MAYNQKNQNTNKEDDFVIYQLQGQKSFLKFKMDWANIGKLHLSFVPILDGKMDASRRTLSKRLSMLRAVAVQSILRKPS